MTVSLGSSSRRYGCMVDAGWALHTQTLPQMKLDDNNSTTTAHMDTKMWTRSKQQEGGLLSSYANTCTTAAHMDTKMWTRSQQQEGGLQPSHANTPLAFPSEESLVLFL